MNVHLGYEVGTGSPVKIPLAHTFVTGQTQLSGKTTTLQALVERSGRRALAFVTKRGEELPGRRVPPYLPREGNQPIHWRLVETILASALGARALKYERVWIINAAKGAKSLADVRRNVDRLQAKAKGGNADVYMLIGEYLDLVLPEMAALGASDTLDLQPGLNVMDLTGHSEQLQSLVIRACLHRINEWEKEILTVFPEAWQFAPRGRLTPASAEAVAMARKGAVLRNFLLCDSQDIAGVDTAIRQATSVWVLGVQRELNELKRTIDSIPAGIAKPKAADVATLELGQFYACWGRHAVKTYVQPAWMDADTARRIALGERRPEVAPRPNLQAASNPVKPVLQTCTTAAKTEAVASTEEPMSKAAEEKLDQVLDFLKRGQAAPPASSPATPSTPGYVFPASEEEALYQRFLTRLRRDLPTAGGPVTVIAPEKLRKDFQRDEVTRIVAAVKELPGLTKQVMKLIEVATGAVSQRQIAERLGRAAGGWIGGALKELSELGLVGVKEKVGAVSTIRAKIAADLAFYQATDADAEAVYQAVLYDLATENGGS